MSPLRSHRHLPYRRMLVAKGVVLGVVLLVMVGGEAQEMQLARWLQITEIPSLVATIPHRVGRGYSVFPTIETLGAQALACLLVVGSYLLLNAESKNGILPEGRHQKPGHQFVHTLLLQIPSLKRDENGLSE